MKLLSPHIINSGYILILIVACSFTIKSVSIQNSSFTLHTNQQYIESIRQDFFDVKDTVGIIKKILSNLPDENIVYPSEGYFYFEIAKGGKEYQGNIGFFIEEKNSFNFSISEKSNLLSTHYTQHIFSKKIQPSDGFKITIYQEQIEINFNHTKKTFTLFNDFETRFSPCLNEELLGTCFDESGMRFQLVYNHDSHHLYYMLEDANPFHLENYHLDIYYEPRSQFAFFKDEICDRYILIGVHQMNVKMNNWFDGPFDQLPDREFLYKKLDLKKFLDTAYHSEIDSLGIYKSDPTSRVAICNYMEYNELIQLLKIRNESLAKSSSYDDFIASLTKSRMIKSNDNL